MGKKWFQERLPREMINRKANEVNNTALPEISKKAGLKFPEEGQSLVQSNYAVISLKHQQAQEDGGAGPDGA